MKGGDAVLIVNKLNHNSLVYTKRYLGITPREVGERVKWVNLKAFYP